MDFTQTKKISNLEVFNNGQNVVVNVQVEITTVPSDENALTLRENLRMKTVSKNYRLNGQDTITPETEGFIPFENLTEEIVFGWISEELQEDCNRIMERISSRYEAEINPPAPRTLNKDIPW